MLTLYLWYELPALSRGLSIRPPPAMMPTIARQSLLMVLRAPDGSLTRVLPESGSCQQVDQVQNCTTRVIVEAAFAYRAQLYAQTTIARV